MTAPAGAAIRLRPMRGSDLGPVLVIERDLFAAEAWSEGLFRSELAEHETRLYLVAEDDTGQVVGYAGLAVYPDAAYVQTIAAARDRWGRGVGPALLEALLATARDRGRGTVILEVRADNARAQALYRRYGFVPIGVRKGYYQPSNTDAVVMARDDR